MRVGPAVAMDLLFDPGLPHQQAALHAVLDLFVEPAPSVPAPSVPAPSVPTPSVPGLVGNAMPVDDATLLANLRAVQAEAGLPVQTALTRPAAVAGGPPCVEVTLDMETGTGKTYTYLRTILELSRRHALHKWLVIVPSIAIREGVLSTLRQTREHFRGLMPEVAYRFWAYDGRPERIRGFVTAGSLEIGVLTIAAFNKIGNRLRRSDDRFGGQSPLAWIAAARPCLVLDEPHHYDSPLSKTALGRLHPLLALRYGATHRSHAGLVHRLDARTAAARGLVKRVEVAPVAAHPDDATRISAQIHETIRLHVQRQAQLAPRGIKVLSLFFVDHVASYTDPEGLCRVLFDRHLDALKHGCPTLAALPAARTRAAYFATKARRGGTDDRAADDRADTAADAAAYQLILRDKGRLLSLAEPVAFIFSHSALREGWDNPNVFQVCTLAPRGSSIRRRQEIGRGIRLCVDAHGRRVGDPSVDVLSVVPAESYEDFIAAWQAEHDADAPGGATRPPTPTRSGASAPAVVPQARSPVPWIALDSAALIAAATAQLGADAQSDAATPPDPALPGLVAELLARRRPTIALTPGTIATVVALVPPSRRGAARIADAIAHAVAEQGG